MTIYGKSIAFSVFVLFFSMIVVPRSGQAQLVQNGDFSQGLTGWTTDINAGCGGTRTASVITYDSPFSQVLEVKSVGAGGCGGALSIYQGLNIALSASSTFALGADVKAVSATVGNSCGWEGQEYPIQIQLSFTQSSGSQKRVIFAFYYGGGSCGNPTNVGSDTTFVTKGVTQNQWSHFDSGDLNRWIPTGLTITRITILGAGWDYVGRADNVSLAGAGGKLVFSRGTSANDLGNQLWVADTGNEANPRQLTTVSSYIVTPRWSPDGQRIAFATPTASGVPAWIINGDGTGLRQVPGVQSTDSGLTWNAAGNGLVYATLCSCCEHLRAVDADGANNRLFFRPASGVTTHPDINPTDATLVAYHRAACGNVGFLGLETARDGGSSSTQIPMASAVQYQDGPRWLSDGQKLVSTLEFSTGERAIEILDPANPTAARTRFLQGSGEIRSVDFACDTGNVYFTRSTDGFRNIWRATTAGVVTQVTNFTSGAIGKLDYFCPSGSGGGGPVQLAVNQVDTSKCPQISLVNSVTDSNGTLIPGLTGSNFNLTEDNQARTISVSQTSSGSSAVSVALVIDVSGSLSTSGVSDEVAAAKAFLNLLGPQDRVALITFQSTVTTRVPFTTDRAAIDSALNSLSSGGNTALLDGIVRAAQLIGAEPQGRRAVVLMTDGYENASTSSEAQALAAAKAANSPVFTIGFTSDIKEDELRRIADGTGGIFYRSATSANLQNILTRLGQVITSQYIVSYTTANAAVSHQGNLTVNAAGQSASKGFTVNSCAAISGGLTLGTANTSQCPQIRVPVSVTSGGQPVTGLGAANFTLVEDGQSRSISVNQTSAGYEIVYTTPNPSASHQVMVSVNYAGTTDSKTTTVPSCGSGCGSTLEPSLNITLQPGFYIAEVTGSIAGYWGMEALAQRGDLSGGFNLGGGIQENGATPGFGAFYLRDTQNVFIRMTAQVVPGGNASGFSMCVRLLDSNRQPIGTDQCATTVVEFQRTLNSGFYVVEVRSGASSPRATFQLGLAANYFSGGVDVGGFLAPGLTGFGAFYLPSDQGAQEAKIKVLGRPTYGSGGTCDLKLRLLDGNRNVIRTVP